MGTTAEKLTYLNDTKSLLKDSINSLGGEITSQTTFRQYATELDSIYASLPKVSGTGSSISLSPTRKGRLGSVLKGNTFQQTYTGKNLFDINGELYAGTIIKYKNGFQLIKNNDNRTLSMVLTKSLPAGEYTISSNIVSNTLSDINKLTINFRTSNSSIIMINLDSTGKKTFTLTDTATNFYVYIANSESDNAQITLDNIQIETGSTATSYEPYVGGIGSPNPSYPQQIQSVTGLQKITVCGKNLFDKNNIKIGYRFGSTGDYYANAGYNATNYYISVTPNTTYATSWTISQMECVCTYDINKTFKRRIQSGTSFTTDSDEYFVRADVKDENLATAQIELGSTATTYEAYQGQTKELNLGKNLLNESLISNTNRGLTWSYANSKININGTTTSTYSQSNKINLILPVGTYVFSKSTTSNASFGIWLYNQNNTLIATGTPNNAITINEEVKSFALYVEGLTSNTQYNIDINVMLEKGSNASSYSPYFTPIKLNKINDYQDYITGTPNNWSIKRQIGSITLNGSETGWQYNNNFYYILISNIIYGNIQFSTGRTLCDDYTDYGITLWQDSSKTIPYGYLVNNGSIFIRNVDITSLENFKTYLSSHNIELVYQLETETTEPITNTELISQLNEIYYLQSYNGTTNITITSEDLALIMNASALKGEA